MKNPVGNLVIENNSGELIELKFTKLEKEVKLDEMVLKQPSLLQLDKINEDFADPLLMIDQFGVSGNRLDVLLINKDGRITVVESKLQKNSEGKRKVFGQVLDYATSLHNLSYVEFSAKCGKYAKDKAVLRGSSDPLISLIEAACLELGEKFEPELFRKNVSRDLELGRFLLIVLGDEVHSELAEMVEFLTDHSKLGFEFAAVEFLHFDSISTSQMFIIPRIVRVFSREFIPWKPDRNSDEAQRINKVVSIEQAKSTTSRISLSDAERGVEFMQRLERRRPEDAEVIFEAVIAMNSALQISDTDYVLEFAQSGNAYYVILPNATKSGDLTLFAIDSKGTMGGTGRFRKEVETKNGDASIWFDFWSGLESMSNAGKLYPEKLSGSNIFFSAHDQKLAPDIVELLGFEFENLPKLVSLLDAAVKRFWNECWNDC